MTAAEPAIVLRGLHKRFVLKHRAGSLKNLVLRRNVGRREIIHALNGVDLTVPRGQTLAVVGKNGSGKSTLLGVLARIYRPNEGEVTVNGRVAPLLELGAGFHPDLTGLDNLLFNGAILGMSQREIEAKQAAIVRFAELEKFIDTPVRGWSQGMMLRLGFSIAVHADPEIVLIDEVLAVGDESFREKCYAKIGEFQQGGHTIIFVTHLMHEVRRVAQRVVWLDNGMIRADGPTEEMVDLYLAHTHDPNRRLSGEPPVP